MNMTIEYLADPDPGVAGVREDGKRLRLFLAGQILHLAMTRKVGLEEVAGANGMTPAEFEHLMQGGYKDVDVWILFAVLRSLGGVVVVAVEPVPDLEEGFVMWSKLSGKPHEAGPSARRSKPRGP